jgi:hypothetical protein
MARRSTVKKHSRKPASDHKALSIPMLRKAFEHIEAYARANPRDVDGMRAEWKKVFYKEIDRRSAEEYLSHMANYRVGSPKKGTRRLRRGGAAPLAGAPIGYDMRPGVHISAGVDAGSYAVVPDYVYKGFWNPEIAQQYDPVPGQTAYVTRTPAGMGDNTVLGGVRGGGGCPCDTPRIGGKRKLRKGGGIFNDALRGLVGSAVPQNPMKDAMDMFAGKQVGNSPDATDRRM